MKIRITGIGLLQEWMEVLNLQSVEEFIKTKGININVQDTKDALYNLYRNAIIFHDIELSDSNAELIWSYLHALDISDVKDTIDKYELNINTIDVYIAVRELLKEIGTELEKLNKNEKGNDNMNLNIKLNSINKREIGIAQTFLVNYEECYIERTFEGLNPKVFYGWETKDFRKAMIKIGWNLDAKSEFLDCDKDYIKRFLECWKVIFIKDIERVIEGKDLVINPEETYGILQRFYEELKENIKEDQPNIPTSKAVYISIGDQKTLREFIGKTELGNTEEIVSDNANEIDEALYSFYKSIGISSEVGDWEVNIDIKDLELIETFINNLSLYNIQQVIDDQRGIHRSKISVNNMEVMRSFLRLLDHIIN